MAIEQKPKREKYYKNTKKWREHEMQVELLRVLQGPNGYEIMLLMGAAGGAASAYLASMFPSLTPKKTDDFVDPGGSSFNTDLDSYGEAFSEPFRWVGANLSHGLAHTKHAVDDAANAIKESTDLEGSIKGVIMLGGTGFAGLCMSLLILHALFPKEGFLQTMQRLIPGGAGGQT